MTVTIEDIATTLQRSTPTEQSKVGKAWAMWIEDARLQINRWAINMGLAGLADLEQGDVDFVVREAVAIKVKRPDPVVKVDIAIDDGNLSKTYEKGGGQVTILPEWWDLLTPSTDADLSGAWTINPFGNRCR